MIHAAAREMTMQKDAEARRPEEKGFARGGTQAVAFTPSAHAASISAHCGRVALKAIDSAQPMEPRAAAVGAEGPKVWCETCREAHGPSGPHAGEIIPLEKAEILREIDRQHATELDAVFQPSASSLVSELGRLVEKWRELAKEDRHRSQWVQMALQTCAYDVEAALASKVRPSEEKGF